MNVTVEYFAQLRTRSGLQHEDYALPDGSSATDLVEAIKNRHQGPFAEFLGGDDPMPGWITVIQEDQPISMTTALKPDCTIRFLAPISGG